MRSPGTVIRGAWIDTGPNKAIVPNELQHALGPETVDGLSRETGIPRDDDLLSQLSRLLPEAQPSAMPATSMLGC